MTIALIGAGAAGAACVSVLRTRRADFCVFEKSRGVGGRMCTRRVADVIPDHNLFFNHGCPSFELTSEIRKKLSLIIGPETMRQVNNNEWVSVPTMPQLIKDLIGSTEIKTQCEIDAVRGEPGNWYLIEKQKDPNQAPRQHGPFQKVVLTAPAPQALNLLRNLEHNWACPLKEVQYSSCWVLLKTIRHNPNIKFLPSRVFSSIRPQKFSPDDTHFNNISSWIAYTEPTWSHRNLELEAGEILEILSEEFFKVLNDGRPDVLYSNVHRWRYAQVTQSLKIPFLYDSSESLFYVSDSCLGNGIEGALSSGLEVGTYLCDNLR